MKFTVKDEIPGCRQPLPRQPFLQSCLVIGVPGKQVLLGVIKRGSGAIDLPEPSIGTSSG